MTHIDERGEFGGEGKVSLSEEQHRAEREEVERWGAILPGAT